jgi:DNA recombination protein RmuC
MDLWTVLTLAVSLLALGGVVALLLRIPRDGGTRLDRALRDELRLTREETERHARALRAEVLSVQTQIGETLTRTLNLMGEEQRRRVNDWIGLSREDAAHARTSLENLVRRAEDGLRDMRESNDKQLDAMRRTVDEKLHSTLEKRLGESFRLVGERLEAVQRGLGEMQVLAAGVGDLKRLLTSVKDRGTWGERQLEAILQDVLTPEQYGCNVGLGERGGQVEFAVKLPGRDGASPVWLPIDAKFPKEDYERLQDAAEQADAEGVKNASRALAAAILKAARDIREKYIAPPATTDFAILFLPTESLYAEILRQPGLHDELRRTHCVLVAGPTNLAAILSSLRVGFQTLAIEKRAHEVWSVLGAVKSEFGKFGGVLGRIRKQLDAATNTIDESMRRTRAMERKLRDVQQLPESEARSLLSLPDDADTPAD